MRVEEMRRFISEEYPGTNWKNRVKRMNENQIIAIYYNIESKQKKNTDVACVATDIAYEQLSMFDILEGEM